MNTIEAPVNVRKSFGCFGVVFGSIFVLVGLLLVSRGIYNGVKQYNTKSWVSVVGQFDGSMTPKTVVEKDGYVISQETNDTPFPRYKYVVNEKVYYGNRVIFTDESNLDNSDINALCGGHSISGEITVYYSKSDPRESVLHRGYHSLAFKGLGFGALFAGFALFWITMWWGMSVWLPKKMESMKQSG